MKTPYVIFFYSHVQEKQFAEALNQVVSTVAFPLDRTLKREYLSQRPSLVILWDTTKEEQGIARLKEVNTTFPYVPLFLIVEDPSKEYLMAALKFKVSNYFTLPANNTELNQAILQAVKENKKIGPIEKARGWFRNFQHHAQSLIMSLTQPAPQFERALALEGWEGGTYPHIHSSPRQLETENSYDIGVQFFGNFNLDVREKPSPRINGKKNVTLLAYLLFHHKRPTHREILMDKFWRDFAPSSARNSLNVAICSIRKNLSETFKSQDIILYESESYGINPELKIVTDTDRFLYYWKKGNAIESSKGIAQALDTYNIALSYYKEEFLSNIRFDNWCENERDNLKEIYLLILNRLSIYFFEQKQYNACISTSMKMLSEDNYLEEVHRKLMACYYMSGQAGLALKQYYKCKKALDGELNLSPSEPTLELFERIQNGRPIQA